MNDTNKTDNATDGGLHPMTCSRLAACEQRAIEIYYAAPPEKQAGECRAELVAEFGEECVSKMLVNGIGNNGHKWNDGAMVRTKDKSWRLEWCECGADRQKPGSLISSANSVY